MTNSKRKRVLVDGSVQWSLVRQSLVHWCYHCLYTVLLLMLLQVLVGGIFKTWHEHWQTMWPLVASVLVSLVVLLPKFIYDSLVLSHRFAGPILRMRSVLRSIAAGQPYKPVKFREGDFWAGMADELNAAVQILAQQSRRAEPLSRPTEPEEVLSQEVSVS
jgi:hypothetical protein